jgi:hypothetical protein
VVFGGEGEVAQMVQRVAVFALPSSLAGAANTPLQKPLNKPLKTSHPSKQDPD